MAKFANSDVGKAYQSSLAERSLTLPVTFEAAIFFMPTQQNRMQHAEFHFIDFPKGHRESICDGLRNVKGMVHDVYIGGINGATPAAVARRVYNGNPCCGWVTRQDPEADVDQAIWVHEWASAEKERQFKAKEVRTTSGHMPGIDRDKNGELEPGLPIEEHFEEALRRIGAMRIVKEHFSMYRFPYV